MSDSVWPHRRQPTWLPHPWDSPGKNTKECYIRNQASQVPHWEKKSICNAGDAGSIPGSGKSPGGHGNPLQYSCLEASMDRGAWEAVQSIGSQSRKQQGTAQWQLLPNSAMGGRDVKYWHPEIPTKLFWSSLLAANLPSLNMPLYFKTAKDIL